MKLMRTKRWMVLVPALLLTAVPARAGELPAAAARVWAPVGDEIGDADHWAGTIFLLDPHGNDAKAAEDWQRLGQYAGEGLFAWSRRQSDGKVLWARGLGGNQAGGGLRGRFSAGCARPGRLVWSLDYRDFQHTYDATSELRANSYSLGTPPPALDPAPRLAWNLGHFGLRYHLASGLGANLGFTQLQRSGDKGSLLRTGGLDAEPGVKAFDTTTREWTVGLDVARGSLASDLVLAYRTNEGDRAINPAQDENAVVDNHQVLNASLGASYDFSPRLRIQGAALAAKAENDGVQSLTGEDHLLAGEAVTSGAGLGVLARLGPSTNLRVTAGLKAHNTEAQTDLGLENVQAVDRERSSSDLRAVLTHTGLPKTRLQGYLRLLNSDMDEVTTEGGLPGGMVERAQIIIQERTVTEAGFSGRCRLDPRVCLRARLTWNRTEVEQTASGADPGDDSWFYAMGDRRRDRLSWQASLQTTPRAGWRLDLGHQAVDQTFERLDVTAATSWTVQRGFVNTTWQASDRITVYGNVSLGVEEFGLTDGPAPEAGMGAFAYDGRTLRFMPGAALRLSSRWTVECHYEGIRYEDSGDEGVVDVRENDHDRAFIRSAYRLGASLTGTATYQRQEFDENKWDDFIHDLYAVSLSGRFR